VFIHLDVDPQEVGRNRAPDVGIVGDARRSLAELMVRLPSHNRSRESREAELSALKARGAEQMARAEQQAAYALAIREVLPDDGILVSESTQVGYWAQGGGYPVYEPRTFITSGYQGTLGYGFPTALGAQVGNLDRPVVSINGDGGFFYNVQELSTMARHEIPLVAIVFNDHAFGNVRRIQQVRFNDHTIASDLANPDLVRMSEAFGVAATRAASPGELRRALGDALASRRPHLIEVPMPPASELPSMFAMEPLPPRPVLEGR
jgi:acetolactate synthase-1/2/3 large subunit